MKCIFCKDETMVDLLDTKTGEKARFKLPVLDIKAHMNLMSYAVVYMKVCKKCGFAATFHNHHRGVMIGKPDV